MAYKYKLREEEGAEVSPSNREQVTYDVVVTPKDVSVEDTVKALETLSNYGMYVSNLRKEQAIEDRYGPTIPTSKKKLESIFQDVQNTFKNEEEAYDEFIKQALAQNKNIKNLNIKYNTLKSNNGHFYPKNSNTEMQDYIKSLISKPTLLKYKVKDDTIIFPKSGNPAKDLTKKMIDVVMKNAKIDYAVADKEAVDEASVNKKNKIDPDSEEAKLYFLQQFKLGNIKKVPDNPKAEYIKIKMTKEELKEVIREQIKSLIK